MLNTEPGGLVNTAGDNDVRAQTLSPVDNKLSKSVEIDNKANSNKANEDEIKDLEKELQRLSSETFESKVSMIDVY